jgi:hypothetical protein
MTEARTMGRELQDEVLTAVRQSQTAVIEAIRTWTSTVQSITPKLPELNMPFTDTMPKPHEFIANAYDFAEQLLASQRKFAEDILKASAPLTAGKNGVPATKNGVAAK